MAESPKNEISYGFEIMAFIFLSRIFLSVSR